ncbi:hypothetical protein [Streptomyces sp. NRRL S-237]|uniref:hypothetical protein n=1 Tax=Streptomyces sp. NRRL S-237 TaxID=1463895 RepID=UPI000B2390D9|nr:hypothetical protein [Streptomyces sp. NRRL S-237]
MEITTTTSPGRVETDTVRKDINSDVYATGHEVEVTDADGNVTTDRSTHWQDPRTGTTLRDKEEHTVTFAHDSPDGRHAAGSMETTWHETEGDLETKGTIVVGPGGDTAKTAKTTDASGKVTTVTTTTNEEGNGTRRTTVEAGSGTLLSDTSEPVGGEG